MLTKAAGLSKAIVNIFPGFQSRETGKTFFTCFRINEILFNSSNFKLFQRHLLVVYCCPTMEPKVGSAVQKLVCYGLALET